MDLITVDFETFYSKEYSLRRMTTEAYIRDPRFQVIGMGIKVNDDPTEWLTSSGAIVDKLHSFDGKGAMLCHNTAFDGLIAREQFGFNPVFLLDTMSMARPKHALTTGVSLKALAEHYGLGSKGTVLANTMGLRREQFNFIQLAVCTPIRCLRLTKNYLSAMPSMSKSVNMLCWTPLGGMSVCSCPTRSLQKSLFH